MVTRNSILLKEEADALSTADSNHGSSVTDCFHCGTVCRKVRFQKEEKTFCCQGCLTVFELLSENGLGDYYKLNDRAGIRIKSDAAASRFEYLNEPVVRERLVSFQNNHTTRVNFRVPSIHCIACVWLLENLFRLHPGIGASTVNFPRKELSITFENARVQLSEVVSLLASLGYEPELNFSDLDAPVKSAADRRLALQLGIAGFAFGNNMLFSIALYLGVDTFSGPAFQELVGWISMVLATPVLLYSAQDYFRLAWNGVKHKFLTIEAPIAVGILVIFAQSAYEVISGHGVGYFDSFAGLLFFLLCGRLFQQKTYARLAFDRDFKSFFPLSITRKSGAAEESVSLARLATGDHLIIRNGELIPADSRLVQGAALIDYSFVTGESEPVEKSEGDHLYAGGRHIGGAIEVVTLKPVSQSYLTSLWNQDAFKKDPAASLDTLINRYSQRFIKVVLAIAISAAIYWAFTDSSRALKSFTSVLIVACPCALALAAPFTLGTAIRVLGRRDVFVKGPTVIEQLAEINSVVFDKTGTLTAAGAGSIIWHGPPLTGEEESWLYSMTRHSTHPYAVRIGEAIARNHFPEYVRSFLETAGCGMEGNVAGQEIWMGSSAWLASRGVKPLAEIPGNGSVVHVAINGRYRGAYILASALRPEADTAVRSLSPNYDLALLSGDNERERDNLKNIFGRAAELRFNQSPLDKLGFISRLQTQGKRVMMVGDGLNDAGALKQSNVGIAVVENVGAFSPASDIIMSAGMVPRLREILSFSKGAVRIVRLSFLLSAIYNLIGIAIAASGRLSPIVCAILMPLSSISVVAFATAATTWFGHHAGLNENVKKP
jgi:Cu+-exporting ATPase